MRVAVLYYNNKKNMSKSDEKKKLADWKDNQKNQEGANAVMKLAVKDIFRKAFRVFTGKPAPSKLKTVSTKPRWVWKGK